MHIHRTCPTRRYDLTSISHMTHIPIINACIGSHTNGRTRRKHHSIWGRGPCAEKAGNTHTAGAEAGRAAGRKLNSMREGG